MPNPFKQAKKLFLKSKKDKNRDTTPISSGHASPRTSVDHSASRPHVHSKDHTGTVNANPELAALDISSRAGGNAGVSVDHSTRAPVVHSKNDTEAVTANQDQLVTLATPSVQTHGDYNTLEPGQTHTHTPAGKQ